MENLVDIKTNLISIPEEGVISVQVSGQFYQRINRLLLNLADAYGQEALINTMALIKNNKTHTDSRAFDMETVIIMLRDVELAFEKAGLTKNNEVCFQVPKDVHEAISLREVQTN